MVHKAKARVQTMAEFKLSGSRLVVRGDLDDACEAEMRDCCRELFDGSSGAVAVDLSKVGSVTSTTVGVLLGLWIDLRDAGRSGKIVPSPAVVRVLELTGLAAVLLRPSSGRKASGAGKGKGKGAEGDEDEGGDDTKRGGAKRAKF
jgi:anti-anti-sigma factor